MTLQIRNFAELENIHDNDNNRESLQAIGSAEKYNHMVTNTICLHHPNHQIQTGAVVSSRQKLNASLPLWFWVE